ncbi:MAG: cbb3-type cytochrome c oxidase subunit 3 [Cytophagaceae bacterium]
MLKFIKHHMTEITGIEIYPIISFVLFFSFFIGVTIWVFKTKKEHFNNLSNIPLDDNK